MSFGVKLRTRGIHSECDGVLIPATQTRGWPSWRVPGSNGELSGGEKLDVRTDLFCGVLW
jgi:hypothetical protein